ncbi:MAG: proton-conducting transporter membrane subunit, partial [Pseudomonadota bacterium]
MHHEQDMRKMGGLAEVLPVTYRVMLIGTLAITGVGIPFSYDAVGLPIGFAGFVSKDAIIEGAFAAGTPAGNFAFWALVIAAAFTSFYSWRLMFLTFYGITRDKKRWEAAHESPPVMLWPLYILAGGGVVAGMIWYGDFVGHHAEDWFGEAIFMSAANHVLHDFHYVPSWVKIAPFLAMLGGLAVAFWFYMLQPSVPKALAERHAPIHRFLLNKWYFDELYDLIFVRPAMWLGTFLWKRGDGMVVDGFINGLTMSVMPWLTRLAGRAQSGYVYHYAFAMLIGVSLIITWIAVGGPSAPNLGGGEN